MQRTVAKWQEENSLWNVPLWFALNIIDSLLSYINVSLGAVYTSPMYLLTNSAVVSTVAKYAVVILVAIVAAKIGRLRWLIWFNLGISLVVMWEMGNLVVALLA